jgi:hypothetical protein
LLGRGDVPEPRSDQHQRGVSVGECSDDTSTSPNLADDPLEGIVRADLPPVIRGIEVQPVSPPCRVSAQAAECQVMGCSVAISQTAPGRTVTTLLIGCLRSPWMERRRPAALTSGFRLNNGGTAVSFSSRIARTATASHHTVSLSGSCALRVARVPGHIRVRG